MPEEDPPPFASILLAPEKQATPTLIWRTGVGCEEENYQRDFHDPFTCVEPCIHNTPIYRQTWALTVPAVSGPAKRGTPKALTEPNPLLNADGTAPARRATTAPLGARSLHDPPMGGGPERGKTRRPRYNDKMH
jgi:hypothetical protein